MLIEKDAVSKRYTEYFERLLTGEEGREPAIIAVGREREMNVLGKLHESVKEMKAGKAAG